MISGLVRSAVLQASAKRAGHLLSATAGGGSVRQFGGRVGPSSPTTSSFRDDPSFLASMIQDLSSLTLKSVGSQVPVSPIPLGGILYRKPVPMIRPDIGHKEYKSPEGGPKRQLEDPWSSSRIRPAIESPPDTSAPVEKQAARLIVIRRSKMNKHKLRKLRKKMKFVYAKVMQRRNMRKEKAYLNSKMALIQAAKQFDAKEFVAGVIRRAKEEPIPSRWQDPLMPEWYKEQEINREIRNERYQKLINIHINQSIKIADKNKK